MNKPLKFKMPTYFNEKSFPALNDLLLFPKVRNAIICVARFFSKPKIGKLICGHTIRAIDLNLYEVIGEGLRHNSGLHL